jgi:V8-like Glu-specific endopeptidase
VDFPVQLIEATVRVEQPVADSARTVGTGFLIKATDAGGRPRTVLITAHHVLAGMPGNEVNIGYRFATASGGWNYAPQTLKIRDEAGAPLWTHHPARDVAAIAIEAPPEFAKAAIPANYLAADSFAERNLGPGQELMVLGYPRGLAANNAGFPILRSGRVASYPVAPQSFPTFLLDFSVFPGNSGGPVFTTRTIRHASGGTAAQPVIAGLLTQQVELNSERLEIGVVTHAKYIVETMALMENVGAPITLATDQGVVEGAKPAAQAPEKRSFLMAASAWLEARLWTPVRLVGSWLGAKVAEPWKAFAGRTDRAPRAA